MANNKVYCYHEPMFGKGYQAGAETCIALWRKSWELRGWETHVMRRADAMTDPRFHQFVQRVTKFKTINPLSYEIACWVRWLAFAQVGGGVMTDWDAINTYMTPHDQPSQDEIKIWDSTGVPCAVSASAQGANDIVDYIMAHADDNGLSHYSDMILFRASPWPWTGHCLGVGTTGWLTAPVLHFSTTDCRNMWPGSPKASCIINHTGIRL